MPSIDQIKELATVEANPCVSIFLPTHRTWPETRKDRIEFKNLIGNAAEQLLSSGMRRLEVDELLTAARARLDDQDFWRYQSDGLAAFITPEGTRWLHLPMSVVASVHVGVRFHLKPLLPIIAANGRFYVLTLAQNQTHLFEGNRHGLKPVEADDIPESIAHEEGITQYQQKTGFHPTGPSPTTHGVPAAKRHAGGEAPEDVRENELEEWLRQVAKSVDAWLAEETAPLVAVMDERNFGRFRSFSKYPHLLEEGITEHPESLDEARLHEKAWALVGPVFERRVEKAEDHYRSLAREHHERALYDVTQIVGAAKYGQVATLFVASDTGAPGAFDRGAGQGRADAWPQPGREDLLDRAAVEALLTGADVFALPRSRIPEGHAATAILRY